MSKKNEFTDGGHELHVAEAWSCGKPTGNVAIWLPKNPYTTVHLAPEDALKLAKRIKKQAKKGMAINETE